MTKFIILSIAIFLILFFMIRAVKKADKRFDTMTAELDPQEFLSVYAEFKTMKEAKRE